MNVLINKLNEKLKAYNLGCQVKKETMTLLHCYLYDLNDCIKVNNQVKDYRGCKKMDVDYKKKDLVAIIDNKSLDSFSKSERQNYDMANKLNMLRR